MTTPTTVTINCETGEAIEREMTDAELSDYNALKNAVDIDKAAQEKLAMDKIAAQAKLSALGLTADDLKALGL